MSVYRFLLEHHQLKYTTILHQLSNQFCKAAIQVYVDRSENGDDNDADDDVQIGRKVLLVLHDDERNVVSSQQNLSIRQKQSHR
tara:strand:- start:268 stop:519 length:252 start_codon:yes stop_codon:yes gene_type:complete